MDSSASTRGTGTSNKPSVFGLIKLLARLTPRQFGDEVSMALEQMKQKGVKAGIAAAFLVVAVVFLAFLSVALIVAAILGLATIMEGWLAALLVAALFLVVIAITALIGVTRFKKALPLLPEEAIRGIRYDIGVLREGRSFDPATLDVKKPKEEKSDGKPGDSEPKEPTPSYGELRRRSGTRRDHLADVRDDLGRGLDFKARWNRTTASAKAGTDRLATNARSVVPQRTPAGPREHPHNVSLADRWKPLSIVAGSVAAIVVMVKKLLSR
ncbi:phage holin family protein [Arthrobacter sp. H20]|uniref:phage holin family protein n=1 Tax=Arthrobacter sp. H20 TaxID=1267981 RepID=UPI00047E5AB0|nr:phage holin family protein [Arthrobacter sp. H20]